MKAEHPALARGIYAALLTPRKARSTDGDAAALLDYLDRAVEAGIHGIVLFGSTGEFVHFDPAERIRVASLGIRRSRVPALVNVSHSTLTGTINMAESALKIGAAGVMVMPPYFYRYGDDDIFAFYQQVSSILDNQLPIYLYNLPAFTNPLSFPLIQRLLGLPGVAGIKDSSGDPKLLADLLALRKTQDFQMLAGQERLLVEARQGGADGAVSGLSAAVPELIVALDRAVLDKDSERLALLRNRLDEYLRFVDALPPVLAIRETAAFRGWIHNEPTIPLSPASQAKVNELRAWLTDWIPGTLADSLGVHARL